MILLMTFETEKDKKKFEYLYQKYKNLLLHKAYEILKDYRLAEDAVSEAYLRIYKNLHKIEAVDSNQTISFMVTIARNTALTILQKERKNYTESYDENIAEESSMEEAVLSGISADHIYLAVDKLGDELKEVFLLRYAHEYSNKEIGKLLDIKEKHIAVKLYRAKQRLKKILAEEGYVNEA